MQQGPSRSRTFWPVMSIGSGVPLIVGPDLQRLSTATDSPAAEFEKCYPHTAVIISVLHQSRTPARSFAFVDIFRTDYLYWGTGLRSDRPLFSTAVYYC